MKRESLPADIVRKLKEVAGAVVLLGAIFGPATFAAAASNEEVIAWLKVGDDPSKSLEGQAHRDRTEYEQYRKTQAALIKSPVVLQAALNDPAIAKLKLVANQKQPLDWLKENLSVKFPLESEVLQISLKADDRAEAVKIVNAVADSYFDNVVMAERRNVNDQYNVIDKEISELSRELANKKEEATELRFQTSRYPEAITLARQRFAKSLELSTDIEKKLYETELQIIASRMRAEDAEGGAAERHQAKTDLSIAEAQKKFLQEKQAQLKLQLDEEAKHITRGSRENPRLAVLGDEIKQKQELLQALEKKLQQLSLLIKMPNRVTWLQRATE